MLLSCGGAACSRCSLLRQHGVAGRGSGSWVEQRAANDVLVLPLPVLKLLFTGCCPSDAVSVRVLARLDTFPAAGPGCRGWRWAWNLGVGKGAVIRCCLGRIRAEDT